MILEVFTWPWLTQLEALAGRALTLADVPEEAWDELALPGVDAVWLMGVWERSPAAREVALADPGFRAATAAALPDATRADVVGSPYAIRRYEPDARFGGRAGLVAARAALARRGLRLLLDFVPNHTAPDGDWATEHPEFLVHGTAADVEADPAAWLETRAGLFARGRDPYFPPWPDVLQLDPMSPSLREAVIATLTDMGGQCDGVRCDMAMLFLDDVAERTWRGRLQPRRPEPYWREVIREVRRSRPEFLFIAEAYWDLESELVEQGIDYCYDKRLYDRLAEGDARGVRAHVLTYPAWQAHLVRFLENHDEPRAAAVFSPERLRAAAVALLSLPGAILLHEGQTEGRAIRLPVHLGRRPAEEPNDGGAFWRELLDRVAGDEVRTGMWELLDVSGWPDNDSYQRLLAWRWKRHLVVVNYSPHAADGLVQLPDARQWRLLDLLDGEAYLHDGNELYVSLPPFGAHLFRLES